MTKSDSLPRIPDPPRPRREPMSKMEQYYYALLVHWYRHRKEPPTCDALAGLCRPVKSQTAVRTALLSLESKGYVRRNSNGRFEVIK